jgi:DNA-binding Lrp family transcriptional regulator
VTSRLADDIQALSDIERPSEAGAVNRGLRHLAVSHAEVLSADSVSGPFDLIVLLESPDLDSLGRAVTEGIQKIWGVKRTVTCVVMELA